MLGSEHLESSSCCEDWLGCFQQDNFPITGAIHTISPSPPQIFPAINTHFLKPPPAPTLRERTALTSSNLPLHPTPTSSNIPLQPTLTCSYLPSQPPENHYSSLQNHPAFTNLQSKRTAI
eukprot:TRINITY_DN458_c0_g3_i1.p1 TRINITY_DN458_c0_g3~~TRINITY_DN458_c0_g3_i1.p1  ORF type:complete len:120 (+),score=5.97 TRINITY_DN458_c0_g3_i1:241-600(+)